MRQSSVHRKTRETEIDLSINLDPEETKSQFDIDSGIGFFDHMLTAMAYQAGIDLSLKINGDLEVDDHHSIEDAGIVLGQALAKALGDKKGIHRYGSARVPMDESLGVVDLDFSGRPYLVFDVQFTDPKIGTMSSQMVVEFLRALSNQAGITLHVSVPYGSNDHHKAEALFKALGQAIRQAVKVESDIIPSTKGFLE